MKTIVVGVSGSIGTAEREYVLHHSSIACKDVDGVSALILVFVDIETMNLPQACHHCSLDSLDSRYTLGVTVRAGIAKSLVDNLPWVFIQFVTTTRCRESHQAEQRNGIYIISFHKCLSCVWFRMLLLSWYRTNVS